MNSNHEQSVTFKWKPSTCMKAYKRGRYVVKSSEIFALPKNPMVKFSVFCKVDAKCRTCNSFGVILEKCNVPSVITQIDVLIKDASEELGRFYRERLPVSNHTFKKLNDKCVFDQSEAESCLLLNKKSADLMVVCDIIVFGLDQFLPAPMNPISSLNQKMWDYHKSGCEHGFVIKVNHDVMACQSEFFDRMFLSNAVEAKTNMVTINDFPFEVVEEIIKWFYLGEINPSYHLEEIFCFAEKYVIQELKDQSIKEMIATLNKPNTVKRIILAIFYKIEDLKLAILNFVSSNKKAFRKKVIKSQELTDFMSSRELIPDELIGELKNMGL